MIDLKLILYPTDFSEYAGHARPYVVDLARKFGSQVIVLHVVPAPTYVVSYEIAVDTTTLDEEMRRSARKRLLAIAEELAGEGLQADTIVEVGSPFVEIVRTARSRKVDLIVMATHGWGVIKHMFLGSTAELVVRKAPCPVLTVRHPSHEFVRP